MQVERMKVAPVIVSLHMLRYRRIWWPNESFHTLLLSSLINLIHCY